MSILEDLGIQQAPHSTLNSYLEKLLYLLTGNFGKPGGMNLHTGIARLGGDFPRDTETPVSGERIIIGLVPGNAIPDEMLTDHPQRLRAMIVESANPAHSLADSQRMREALERLDLLVVFDIAMTETARQADYVLPSPSQFEKWEASFFCFEFPANAFQLRRPVMPAPDGLLTESEIHARIVRAAGALDDVDLDGLRAAAERDRGEYAGDAVRAGRRAPGAAPAPAGDRARDARPHVAGRCRERFLPVAAGPRRGAADARLGPPCRIRWGGARARRGAVRGDHARRSPASSSPSTSTTRPGGGWRIRDRKVNLAIPELLEELAALHDEPEVEDADFPFVLAAGERRAHTANTIYRDPAWRKTDADGALRLHPDDARRLGIPDGGRARLTTKRGSVETVGRGHRHAAARLRHAPERDGHQLSHRATGRSTWPASRRTS